jgi:aldehyde:ferredoxin oxidoreductase
LPSGPKKGQAADKARIEEEKHQYFRLIGWDERGVPRSDVLHRLGLEDVDRALEKVRTA